MAEKLQCVVCGDWANESAMHSKFLCCICRNKMSTDELARLESVINVKSTAFELGLDKFFVDFMLKAFSGYISPDYADEWGKRFQKGCPYKYMDFGNRQRYISMLQQL